MNQISIREYFPSTFRKVNINGNVSFEDELVIDGEFYGNLTGNSSSNLVVTPHAIVEGNISCHVAIIRGYVKGTIKAFHVIVEDTGAIKGNLTCTKLFVNLGAKLDCSIHTTWEKEADDTKS